MKSAAAWLASATPEIAESFVRSLSENALKSLPWLFEFWAFPHQLPPEALEDGGPWKTWVILGGRGSGKTRAGAEWVRSLAGGERRGAKQTARRIALIGETYDQAREIMVQGDSGIRAVCPPHNRPVWESVRRRLVWPNGAVAQVFSARDPEALRGPQFDAAWCDELAKWEKGDEAWKNLQFALRLGQDPRQLVTTTPQNVAVLKELLDSPSTVVTRAATDVNEANLARSFLTEIMTQYGGTSTGRQEIEGLLLTETDGALWSRARIEALRLGVPDAFSRIVVAVDPATTGKPGADECGIIVAGAVTKGPKRDWRAWVLEDCTVPAASPNAWADEAVRAFHRHRADRLVVEVNQGGDMVRSVIETVDGSVPIRTVTASRGKHVRAEPVAALYEQGRVHHVRGLDKLEDQMCAMTRAGYNGRGSPDRVDALVWALSELMIEPPGPQQDPRVRTI